MQPTAQPQASPADRAAMGPAYLIWIAVGLFGSLALFASVIMGLHVTGNLPPPAFSNSLCADEKLGFMREHPVPAPNVLVIGSSVAWRHFDGQTVAERAPGVRPLNGAFCGLHANQSVYVANWLLDRETTVEQVLMIVDPLDFAGCSTVATAVFDRRDADAYVYGQGSAWLPYMRYFTPGSLLRNARTVKAQRTGQVEFDPLVFNRYGDGPLDTQNSRDLLYGQPEPLDPTCFAALDSLAQRLKREGRQLTVVATPLHPQWKAEHESRGQLLAEFDSRLRQTLAHSGAQFWNADTDHRISETAFVDAIHLRWSAAQVLSVDISARLAPDSQMAVVQRQ
ncbi:hypothetical protein AO269_12985 [Pseudomonas putida]|nr:hypothetical protein AO269_12985 [Pseudomonas putida]